MLSRRRRILGVALILAALTALLTFRFLSDYEDHRREDCRAKGGVYLKHEEICVRGIEEVR